VKHLYSLRVAHGMKDDYLKQALVETLTWYSDISSDFKTLSSNGGLILQVRYTLVFGVTQECPTLENILGQDRGDINFS